MSLPHPEIVSSEYVGDGHIYIRVRDARRVLKKLSAWNAVPVECFLLNIEEPDEDVDTNEVWAKILQPDWCGRRSHHVAWALREVLRWCKGIAQVKLTWEDGRVDMIDFDSRRKKYHTSRMNGKNWRQEFYLPYKPKYEKFDLDYYRRKYMGGE